MKYILIILMAIPLAAFPQTEDQKDFNSRTSIGIVPQYAIVNGIRFDVDVPLTKQKHWIVFAPQVYISTRDRLFWNYNSMIGAGLEIQHRITLNETKFNDKIYFAYGPTFNFSSVKDDGLIVEEFIENGGSYLGLVNDEITTNIYKLGGNFLLGIKLTIANSLYIDPFLGIGIRFSFDNKTPGLHDYFNEWWGDLGYSGTLMVGGFRIGAVL